MVYEPEDMVTHEIILSALGLVIAIARARARPRSLTIFKSEKLKLIF